MKNVHVRNLIMFLFCPMVLSLAMSCTIKQENAILDIISPREVIGYETVYKYNFVTNEIEDVLSSQPIYLDGEGELIYVEIGDSRLGFSKLSKPIYVDGVVLRYAADKYCVEELPEKE